MSQTCASPIASQVLPLQLRSGSRIDDVRWASGPVVRVPGCRHRGPGFDSRRYQIFCVTVGLERGPLSLVRINQDILERKSSGSGLES
jgi:hypothetical protein